MRLVPEKLFLTKGVGRHAEKLGSFEAALRDAGIAHLNLVSVSSIIPPGCRILTRQEGLAHFLPGQIAYSVMSKNETCEPNRMITASVGLAIPKDRAEFGYLSEHHSFGQTRQVAGDYAEDLAVQMLGSTLGLEIDLDKSWDENKEIWKVKGKIIHSRNITQSARGDKRGTWTTVVAAAILVLNDYPSTD
jgi:arginine decarboxylase